MKDTERLARIDQKLTDFMDLYKANREEDKIKFNTLDTLKKRVDRMERPLRWAAGTFTAACIGTLTIMGEKLIQWTADVAHAARHWPK